MGTVDAHDGSLVVRHTNTLKNEVDDAEKSFAKNEAL